MIKKETGNQQDKHRSDNKGFLLAAGQDVFFIGFINLKFAQIFLRHLFPTFR